VTPVVAAVVVAAAVAGLGLGRDGEAGTVPGL
jgi:hypothetical protein